MKKLFRKFKKIKVAFLPIILVIVLLTSLLATFEVIFQDKFFPGVFIGDTNLAFLTKNQAYLSLNSKFENRSQQTLVFNFNDKQFNINLATSSAKLYSAAAITEAFAVGHTGTFFEQLLAQFQTLIFKKTFTPQVELFLDHQIRHIDQEVFISPQDGSLIIDGDQIKITESKDGFGVDYKNLEDAIKNYFVFGQITNQLPTKAYEPGMTTAKLQRAKRYLEQTKENPIKLTFENQLFEIDSKTLMTLLDFKGEVLSDEQLGYFLKEIALKIDQPVKEGRFEFNPNTKRVSDFTPSQDGRVLDITQTKFLITQALENSNTETITLPVKVTKPKVYTENVNNLGIKELLGQGLSNFSGSIENRIYNLGLAASRINGVLIPPGETFSFNNTVGDISGTSGYKPAYVIKSGRTVLDDGGGVCQVSTTIFRAVLNAGLPVVARTAHAYRVGYYEQGFPPGLDATVFSPTVDFIFKNDTQNHILIQAYRVGVTLYVDIYGTSDGRVATLTKPLITNSTPPPPELRQDDPTLPKGAIKQVDWAAWGANVVFTRTVTRGSETLISETFKSNYKPWQAVYLIGTQ